MLLSISCKKHASENRAQILPEDTTSKFKSIKELLNAQNKEKLKAFITKLKAKYSARLIDEFPVIPNDPVLEEEARQIIEPINSQVLSYLTLNYPQFAPSNMVNVNDPDFTYFAQVYSISEQSGFIIPLNGGPIVAARGIPTWLRCTVDIVMGYFDVRALISELGNFSFGSVWTVVKTAIKKYVGWIAAAVLLYDIGTQCL